MEIIEESIAVIEASVTQVETNAYALRGIYSELADVHKREDGYIYRQPFLAAASVAEQSEISSELSFEQGSDCQVESINAGANSPRLDSEKEDTLLLEENNVAPTAQPRVTGQKQAFFATHDVELLRQAVKSRAVNANKALEELREQCVTSSISVN